MFGNFNTPDTTLTPADKCRMSTCRCYRQDGSCADRGRNLCSPDKCGGFAPEHWVRVARRDDGSVYCSRTEFRRDYLDATLGWFKKDADALAYARKQARHGR